MDQVQIPIGLIAEYIAIAATLSPSAPAEHYIAANRLLFQLAMVLPAGLFRLVRTAALSGDPEQIYEALIAVRASIASLGSLDGDDAFIHRADDAFIHRAATDIKRLN